jgi:zinc-ribbon domain
MHHFFFGFVIVVILAIFVAQDANKRGMNGVLWGLGTALLCIVFLPLYLIMRRPLLMAPPPPGYPGTGYTPPPPAGGQNRLCPACGKYHEGTAQFCPHCGAPQPQ